MLQKYYKLLLFGIICALFCLTTGCRYPYTTKKARVARRTARHFKQYQKAEAKRKAALLAKNPKAVKDTLSSTNKKRGKMGMVNTDTTQNDTLAIKTVDTSDSLVVQDSLLINSSDSALVNNDLNQDSTLLSSDSIPSPVKPRQIFFAADSLAGPLQYHGNDSMIYDLRNRKVLLYGGAEVIYQNYELKAGYIELDFNSYIATAEGITDSLGNRRQEPFFNDGNQKFTARKIAYNFKSKKGKVYDASTEQGDGYFLAKEIKFVSNEADSSTNNDIIYAGNCTYTTCNHRHPHFGIRSSMAKVIPNKLIIVGPSYLEIMGTPTPLVLPFGFFPITKTRRSGLILSTNVDNSSRLGLGILGMGYYQAINENIDLKLTGDFYTRGTIRLNASSNYNIRYKSSGNLTLTYARTKIDERGTPDFSLTQDFLLRWTHTQASKAHPSQTFNANVDFGTSSFYRTTTTAAEEALRPTLQSSISYTKRFLGTPFSLALGASHSQNTNSPTMTITLPRTTLTMNQIFPKTEKSNRPRTLV